MKFESQLLGSTIYPKDGYVFFWHGPFSQWAIGDFICTNLDIKVNCAEQAMMLRKAGFFGDVETWNLIFNEKSPRNQKALGRMVKGFHDASWEQVRYDIVVDITRDKFKQSKEKRELLFLTYPHTLVEASPMDKIWGIGMGVDNPNLLNHYKWGLNLLGKALTQVRNELMLELG